MTQISGRFRLGLPLLAAGLAGSQSRIGRPNILLITVDDLNTDLGCYGHPIVQSPNVDALARRGVRFARAYAQYPVCNPSRTSFLSGRYPETTGVLDNRTDPRVNLGGAPFLPGFLRKNGYFTARAGKIYHDGMDGAGDWDVALNPTPATKIGRTGEGRNLTGGKLPYLEARAAEGTDEDQPDGLIAAEAVRLIGQQREQPFFLAVGFRKPHDPYIAPKKYFEPYPMDKIATVPGPAGDRADIPTAAFPRLTEDLDQQSGREFRRAYYACISFMDAQVGKVMAALNGSPAAANTLVVFLGDHGLHLGEHGWWNKVTLFERSAAVPFLVILPGTAHAGSVCHRPVELLSLFPSLCDFCGITPPAGLEGRSLTPLLANPDAPWTRPAYTVVSRGKGVMGRAIRTGRYAYIEWDEGRAGVELYDHSVDPHEYRNVTGNKDYQQAEGELKRMLAAARPSGRTK
ncbi:MAG: sulfatase [Bryobacterales bacterium]|nr:sulfatase [Bryobacterales bacterium]